jgi:hypothetical protein
MPGQTTISTLEGQFAVMEAALSILKETVSNRLTTAEKPGNK